MKSKLVDHVIQHYLESGDFNGIPYSSLVEKIGLKEEQVVGMLAELIDDDQIEIMYEDIHPNPHIKAFSGLDKKDQKEKIEKEETLKNSCIYPATKALSRVSQISSNYGDRPYSMELALGAGQLDYRSFDLSVLEVYRNDPTVSEGLSLERETDNNRINRNWMIFGE